MNSAPIQCKQCNALNLPDAEICTNCRNILIPKKKTSLWIGLVALIVVIFLPCFCCNYLRDKGAQDRLNQPSSTPNQFMSNFTNVTPMPSPTVNKSTKNVKNKLKSKSSILGESANNSTYIMPKSSSGGNGYFTGPRGGCYTYSAGGRKRYVDHSYCN